MSERIYDEEIAPLLKQAADLCIKHGFSFVAACEYAKGDTGMTFAGPNDREKTGAAMFLADLGVRCRGNFDALAMAAMKDARLHGHSSFVLSRLGVPTAPSEPVDGEFLYTERLNG